MEMTWEQWKAYKKDLRRQFRGTGWTLLVYYIILNVAVILWMLVETVWKMLQSLPGGTMPDLEQIVMDAAQSGWGYVLAIGVGLLILLLWKKPRYFKNEIFAKGKPMEAGSFFALLSVFLGAQFLSQMMLSVTELVLNQFGLTMVPGLESMAVDFGNFSMFLYAGLFAPISEEILFRGLIQRRLMPFGKRFAIFCSAFTFGLFHGNLVQAPFAFLVGLVLGYVAAEYNICWAMLLHMINNLVIADMLTRVTSFLPEAIAGVIIWLILLAFAVAGLVVLIRRREDIRSWRKAETIHGIYLRCFFGNGGMICFLVIIGGMLIYTLTALIAPMG